MDTVPTPGGESPSPHQNNRAQGDIIPTETRLWSCRTSPRATPLAGGPTVDSATGRDADVPSRKPRRSPGQRSCRPLWPRRLRRQDGCRRPSSPAVPPAGPARCPGSRPPWPTTSPRWHSAAACKTAAVCRCISRQEQTVKWERVRAGEPSRQPEVRVKADAGGQRPPRPRRRKADKVRPPPGAGREAPSRTPAMPMPQVPTAPVSAAAPAMPPADRTRMLAQVTESLEARRRESAAAGRQQVTLQLHPKDWGR